MLYACYSPKVSPLKAHPSVSRDPSIPKLAIVLLIFGALSAIFGALYLYNPHFFGRHFEEIKVLGYGTLGGGFLLFALGAVWSLKTFCRSTKSSVTSSSPVVPISVPVTEPIKPQQAPLARTETHHNTEFDHQYDVKSRDINQKKVMRVFYGNNQDPYKQQLRCIITAGGCTMSILNLTHRAICVPTFKALEILAKCYAQEHGIALNAIKTDQLCEVVLELQQSTLQHSFVGCVVTLPDDSNRHACSLICYKGPSGLEFLMIDTSGAKGLQMVERMISMILLQSFPDAKIFYYREQHQADKFSCRTGAIVLLTRALKDLTGKTIPLDTLLPCRHNSDSSRITKLPSGWLTKEQIYTAQTQAETQERESDMEFVTLQCSLQFVSFPEGTLARGAARNQLRGLKRPAEVTQCVTDGDHISCIQFNVSVSRNTYLVRQGYIHAQMCAAASN